MVTVDAPELDGVVTDIEWDGKCFWITQSDTTIYAAVPVFKLTPDPPTTGEIVADLCDRVGLAAGDIDVTDLTDE